MTTSAARTNELAAFVEALPVLVWASGQDHGGVYFNRAWRDFTGRSQDELAGEGWMANVHPEDLPVLATCAAAFLERQPFEIEFRLRRHDGAWRWMLDVANPHFGKAGRFKGFVGACTDTRRER
jgi:two-component system, sensor histidine kinase PdtaS